jgi:hypothetical protein
VYARVTLLEIDTVRVLVDDAISVFRDAVMPRLRDQAGYQGVYALATPEGKAMVVSFWDTAAAADSAAEGWYPAVLEEYMTMFRSPPGREHYEVRFAEPPLAASETVET